jgi:hypothetical protein
MIPGKYIARVIDCSITETAAGLPQPTIRFKWSEADGTVRQYNWTGSLKDAAQEITCKALAACGFVFTKDDDAGISQLVNGPEGLLDATKDVEIDVQNELGNDGKTYAKIRWVNEVGGAKFKKEMSRADAKIKIAGMSVKGTIAKLGVAAPKQSNLDIPF